MSNHPKTSPIPGPYPQDIVLKIEFKELLAGGVALLDIRLRSETEWLIFNNVRLPESSTLQLTDNSEDEEANEKHNSHWCEYKLVPR